MESDFSRYRRIAMKAAKDLKYPSDVLDKLKKAKSEAEIERIMHSARDAKFNSM